MTLTPKLLVQSVLRAYKALVSPLLPQSCRFTPTCSEYAMEAVEIHGIFIGTLLSAWRILRCNPFSRGGLDTVPSVLGFQRETRNQKLETVLRKT